MLSMIFGILIGIAIMLFIAFILVLIIMSPRKG